MRKWIATVSIPVLVNVEVEAESEEKAREYALAQPTYREVAMYASSGALDYDASGEIRNIHEIAKGRD